MIAFRSLCFVWMLKKSDFLRCVCVCTKRCLLFCFYYCGHKSRVFLQSAVSAAPKWSKRINARKKSSASQCSSRFKVAAAVAVVATAPTTAKCVVYCDPNCKLLPTPNIRNSSFVHTHTEWKSANWSAPSELWSTEQNFSCFGCSCYCCHDKGEDGEGEEKLGKKAKCLQTRNRESERLCFQLSARQTGALVDFCLAWQENNDDRSTSTKNSTSTSNSSSNSSSNQKKGGKMLMINLKTRKLTLAKIFLQH